MIASLMVVDYVFIMPPINAVVTSIETLKPNILIVRMMTGIQANKDSPEAKVMAKFGGEKWHW